MTKQELNEKEIQAAGLAEKVQIFWDSGLEGFVTSDKKEVSVKPLGPPIQILSHYDTIAENKGYDAYLGDTSYVIKGREYKTSSITYDKSLAQLAAYYCVGEMIQQRKWPKTETDITAVSLYKAAETMKKAARRSKK